jgi:hypothetical protein
MHIFVLIALGILISILATMFAIVLYVAGYLSYHHHQDMKIARDIVKPTVAPSLESRWPKRCGSETRNSPIDPGLEN